MDGHKPNAPADAATPRPWLHRFSFLVIAATFALIAIGGKVTSYDVGMAVPDGFTTFGHITFLAPVSEWWHDFGTRWEHSHRLQGNLVGVLTIAMAWWLLYAFRDKTKHDRGREQYGRVLAALLTLTARGERPWLRWSGVVMLLLVISQGVMGALRVEEVSITLAFVHGIVGQLILCSWVVVAAALSGPWLARLTAIRKRERSTPTPKLRWAVRGLLVLLIVQLTLGAAVRHFKADKAIPDFPLTYGHVLPPTSQKTLDKAYVDYHQHQARTSKPGQPVENRNPQGEIVFSLGDVYLQLAHRLGAYLVFGLGVAVLIGALRKAGDRSAVFVPATLLLTLLVVQVALGVYTVLTGTHPVLATMHQATGAVLIATATWLAVRLHLAEYAVAPATTDKMTAAAAPPAARPTLSPAHATA